MLGKDLADLLAFVGDSFIQRSPSPSIKCVNLGSSVDQELCDLGSISHSSNVEWGSEIVIMDDREVIDGHQDFSNLRKVALVNKCAQKDTQKHSVGLKSKVERNISGIL